MDLYTIHDQAIEESPFSFTVDLNPEHPVYKGHFPAQPVTPGVLLSKMIRELTEKALDKKLRLVAAHHIKFLRPVDPNHTPRLNIIIQPSEGADDSIKVNAVASFNEETYFKISASFTDIS
jgi:3-hydroxyacyl-[acyl-carrier-protein] dehydratase